MEVVSRQRWLTLEGLTCGYEEGVVEEQSVYAPYLVWTFALCSCSQVIGDEVKVGD